MARKILLADDSVTAQNMGRKILADAGYEVITVNNGSAALKKIAEQKPDVIVLDVYMPGYSGLEVCQRLKEVGETARIPILLTVGKLEPFKQEEVKRVRADGFIVKPFEASELLSALSKLEDRIVPRSEPSKPGRFARATAALEEGRYDKTVAIEEDSGWKNRISFPSKKHEEEKETPADADDSAIYNPVNKDLRTVVEHKVAAAPNSAKAEAELVDLGALAPLGLPKDVTPEEIAALAAAAAQVQGKIAESKIAEAASTAEPAASAVVAPKTESKEEFPAAVELKPEPVAEAIAEAKPQEPVEAKEAVVVPAASTAQIAEASAEVEARAESDQFTSASPSLSASAVETPADEPVTMAMAGGAPSSAASSRWTAVSVAPAPEETGISLEQEMQAYAAYAAAGHGTQAATTSEAVLVAAESAPEMEKKAPELVVSVPAATSPAQAENLSEVASPADEAVSVVARESQESLVAPVAPAEVGLAESKDSSVPAVSEPPSSTAVVEALAEKVAEAAGVEGEKSSVETEGSPVAQPQILSSATEEVREASLEGPNRDEPIVSAPVEAMPVASGSEVSEPESAVSAASEAAVIAAQPTTGTAVEPEHAEPETVRESQAPKESHTIPESPLPHEPDFAATTAAAWASWHRVRESSPDSAAKAVAAGAESSPNDVPAEGSDPAIANIVDSVLADLRPKIVEEISRKLGKKK